MRRNIQRRAPISFPIKSPRLLRVLIDLFQSFSLSLVLNTGIYYLYFLATLHHESRLLEKYPNCGGSGGAACMGGVYEIMFKLAVALPVFIGFVCTGWLISFSLIQIHVKWTSTIRFFGMISYYIVLGGILIIFFTRH